MLFGPTDLLEFREDIKFCISYFLVELGKRSFNFYLLENQKSVCVSKGYLVCFFSAIAAK